MEEKKDIFAKRLLELRKTMGKTLKQVSRDINLSLTGYNGYELGKSNPDFETLVKIAKYFKVSTDYLLGLSDSKAIENASVATFHELHPRQQKILKKANEIGIDETIELMEAYSRLPTIQKGKILGRMEAIADNKFEVAEDFSGGEKTS